MRPSEQQERNESSPTRSRLRDSIIYSLALHAIVINAERFGQIWDEKESIVYMAQQNLKAVLIPASGLY